MLHPLDAEIRTRVIDYIVGDASLDDLNEWIVGTAWSLPEDVEPALADLAYGVMLAVAEGAGNDAATQSKLRPFVTTVRASVGLSVRAVSGSSTTSVTLGLTIGTSRPEDRSPALVFVS